MLRSTPLQVLSVVKTAPATGAAVASAALRPTTMHTSAIAELNIAARLRSVFFILVPPGAGIEDRTGPPARPPQASIGSRQTAIPRQARLAFKALNDALPSTNS